MYVSGGGLFFEMATKSAEMEVQTVTKKPRKTHFGTQGDHQDPQRVSAYEIWIDLGSLQPIRSKRVHTPKRKSAK